jgi:nucleoside-triphosphatase
MRILLEGRPGAGKSTVVRRLADRLGEDGIPVSGFLTEEIRESGRRLGFSLERLAIPALEQAGEHEVAIIDELGKMELASDAFRDALAALLDRPVPVVATVQSASHPFTDALKPRRDVETMRVTNANRDELPELLAARLEGDR